MNETSPSPAAPAASGHATSEVLRAVLLRGLPLADVERVGALFSIQRFRPGEALLLAGQQSRLLGVILRGEAAVQARRDGRALTVEVLSPGSLFGEVGFFDPDAVRIADVVATSECYAALLPWTTYTGLLEVEDLAVPTIERNVLEVMTQRIRTTDTRLAELLEATHQGTWVAALRRFFGVRTA